MEPLAEGVTVYYVCNGGDAVIQTAVERIPEGSPSPAR
jgi:hypothetical protein